MTKRKEKLADLIRSELSNLTLREIKDPRLGLVTFTEVKVSPDLKVAKVFFSTMSLAPEGEGVEVEKQGGNHSVNEVLKGLNSAKGFFKRRMGEVLELRFTPDLLFIYDESFDKAYKIEKILKGLNK